MYSPACLQTPVEVRVMDVPERGREEELWQRVSRSRINIPGRSRGFPEMFKSVLYAQNGMSAELQVEVR